MSRQDVLQRIEQVRVPVAGGYQVKTVEDAQSVCTAAGSSARGGEVTEIKSFLRAEARNGNNDQAVREWAAKQEQTIAYWEDQGIPEINAKVEADRAQTAGIWAAIEDTSQPAQTILGMLAQYFPDDVESRKFIPKELQAYLANGRKHGLESYDVRELDQGVLNIDTDHGFSIGARGKFQRYPQERALGTVLAATQALESDPSRQPSQLVRRDALDPRVTQVNGEILDRLVNTPQLFNVDEGGKIVQSKVRMTWAQYAMTDRDPDAIGFEYDDASHPDHLAWSSGDGGFSGHWAIDQTGAVQWMTAPRRSLAQDSIEMAGGILTTGALFRGLTGLGHGHVRGEIQKVHKDESDPTSPLIDAFVVTGLGISGFVCDAIANGDIKLADPVKMYQLNGIRVAPGLKLEFEDSDRADQIWLNPTSGLYEKRP